MAMAWQGNRAQPRFTLARRHARTARAKHPDLDCLFAVAAKLSASHMNWWIAIADAIRRLSEARDREQAEAAIHEMLVNIRELDRLEY